MGYVFDPLTIHQIGARAVGKPISGMFKFIEDELARAYPGHINTGQDWIFSLFGGTTSVLKLLHASLSEYIILFGTPNGTNGFSGRFAMDVYDTVLCGEMFTFNEDEPLTRIIHKPGEHAKLDRFKAKGWGLTPEGWLLEYARGFIPAGLPFGLADALFSAMDPVTLGKTLWQYGSLTLKEMLKGKI